MKYNEKLKALREDKDITHKQQYQQYQQMPPQNNNYNSLNNINKPQR